MKEFDYYIFIDYSENFLGYNIIHNSKINELAPKISRLRHYKGAKNRKLYLKNVTESFKREKIEDYFLKIKIKKLINSPEIYSDIAEFINKNINCIIFISIDDRQFGSFKRLVNIVSRDKVVVKKEGELKKGTIIYQISLVIDNLLNIERRKNE